MDGMIGGHVLIETAAALVLSIGGGLIVLRAVLERRSAVIATRPIAITAAAPLHAIEPSAAPIQVIDRFEVRVAAALSLGAGLIHLAAGPAHLIELGALGLGFYLAGIFQIAVAALLLVRSGSRSLVWIAIGGNIALIGAWAWSRSVGLPGVAGGPESAGASDGITVVLQFALIAVLWLRLGGWDARLVGSRSARAIETFVTAGLVAILGVIVLSTTIAVVDVNADHALDGDMAPHSAMVDGSAPRIILP